MKQGSYLKHLAPTVGHKEDILSEMGKHNMNISCELVEEMMKADMNTFAKDIPCLASSERKGIDDRIKDVWGSQGDNPVYIRDIPHVQSASQPIEGAKTPTDLRFPIPVSEIRDRKRPLGQMIWKRPVQKPTAISKEKAEHKRRIHRFNIQYPSTSTLSDPEIKEHVGECGPGESNPPGNYITVLSRAEQENHAASIYVIAILYRFTSGCYPNHAWVYTIFGRP